MRSAPRPERDEAGASLVIVLLLITVASLVVGAVLTATSTAQISMQTTKAIDEASAAADRGIEHVLQTVRSTGSCGPATSTGEISVPTEVKGATDLRVRCEGTVTSTTGTPMTHAVVLLDSRPRNLSTQSGSCTKAIQGDVYLAGQPDLSNQPDLEVAGPTQSATCGGNPSPQGFVYQHQATATPCTKPSWLKVATGGATPHYACGPAAAPDPDPALPAKPAAAPAPATTALGCKVFFPGTYTSAPALGTSNYFVSGVYAFDAVGVLDLTGRRVIGGEPNPDAGDSSTALGAAIPADPCLAVTDASVGAPTSAKGVQWVLGGGSAVYTNGDGGSAGSGSFTQLYSYRPATGSTDAARVAIRTVKATAAGWTRWSPPPMPSGNACSPLGFTSPAVPAEHAAVCVNGSPTTLFRVDGLVHVPNASVALQGGNDVDVALQGGIVAFDLALQSQPPVLAFTVAVRLPSPTTGISTIRAGAAVGDRCITAVVQIDAAQANKVTSWRVLGDGTLAGGYAAPSCAG